MINLNFLVPDELFDFLAEYGEAFYNKFKEEFTSDGISTVLEASGEKTKNITKIVNGVDIISKVRRYGVPVSRASG